MAEDQTDADRYEVLSQDDIQYASQRAFDELLMESDTSDAQVLRSVAIDGHKLPKPTAANSSKYSPFYQSYTQKARTYLRNRVDLALADVGGGQL